MKLNFEYGLCGTAATDRTAEIQVESKPPCSTSQVGEWIVKFIQTS